MEGKNRLRLCLGLPATAFAQEGGTGSPPGKEPEAPSADAIAKELSVPAGSLASLETNFEYRLYEGDLPDARDQDGRTQCPRRGTKDGEKRDIGRCSSLIQP